MRIEFEIDDPQVTLALLGVAIENARIEAEYQDQQVGDVEAAKIQCRVEYLLTEIHTLIEEEVEGE